MNKKIKVTCEAKEYLPIDQLQDFQGKLKKLNDDDLERLKGLLLRHGFSFPVFVWNNYILDGHQRLTALKALMKDGYQLDGDIPVVKIQAKDATEAAHKLLALNSQFGQIKPSGLKTFAEEYGIDLLKELPNLDFPTIDTQTLLKDLNKQAKKLSDDMEDTLPDSEAPIKIKSGDLIELGEHKLLCGDSTKEENFERLMSEEKAHLVVTDPPYGIDYKSWHADRFDKIANDKLVGNNLTEFLKKVFNNFYKFTINEAAFYIFYASTTYIEFKTALKKEGFKIKQQLIWDKGLVLSKSDYHWSHEPILYCVKEGHSCKWYGDRTDTTILKGNFDDLKKLSKKEILKILDALQNNRTIWTIKRDAPMAYLHPTQKPVALLERAILNSSQLGDIVIDGFAGSGSTVLACEKTGRKCRAIEYEPKYCQVIIDRWCEYTGTSTIKVNGKATKWLKTP